MTNKTQPNFEETLTNLETITQRLESGELPLEEALSLFEQGISLTRIGQSQLEKAEQRIQILLNPEDEQLANFESDQLTQSDF